MWGKGEVIGFAFCLDQLYLESLMRNKRKIKQTQLSMFCKPGGRSKGTVRLDTARVSYGIIMRCTVFVTGLLTAEATGKEDRQTLWKIGWLVLQYLHDLQKMAMENFFSHRVNLRILLLNY